MWGTWGTRQLAENGVFEMYVERRRRRHLSDKRRQQRRAFEFQLEF